MRNLRDDLAICPDVIPADSEQSEWEEAVRRAMAAEERVEDLKFAIARAIDGLQKHDHEDSYSPYGLADTRCIVHDGRLCDVLRDLQAVLDKGEEG